MVISVMTQRSETRKKWSRRANAGCMWGPISMFDFLGNNSPKFLTNPNYRDGQRYDHRYKGCKLKILTNFKRKHEILNKVNQVELSEGKSAAKQVIQKENFKVKQPKQHSMAASEVIELKSSRSPCIMNYAHMNDTYYEGHNICNNELKLPKYSKTEQHNFWELLQKISNLDLLSLFKELGSRKDKAAHLDPGSHRHLSPTGQDHHEMSDFPDELSKEQVQDYFIFRKSSSDVLRNSACNTSLSDGRTSIQESRHYEEFRLKNLNPDKLLEKGLQDPNSPLIDYTQNPPDGTSKKLHAEQSHKTVQESEPLPSGDSLSRLCRDLANDRRIHPPNMNTLILQDESLIKTSKVDNDSKGPRKIVVLKPQSKGSKTAPNPHSSGAPAYSAYSSRFDKRDTFIFYLQEIKNRLKHFLGDSRKNQSMIERDGIIHRIPSGNSPSRSIGELQQSGLNKPDTTSSYNQESPVKIGPKKMSKTKLDCKVSIVADTRSMERNTAKVAHHNRKKSNGQMESKMLLHDFICEDDDDDNNDKMLPKVSKSLGKQILLPKHDQKYPGIEPFSSPRPINCSSSQHPQETKLDALQSPCLKQGISAPVHCTSTFKLQEHKRDPSPITLQKQKGALMISDCLALEDENKGLAEVTTESGHEEHRCSSQVKPNHKNLNFLPEKDWISFHSLEKLMGRSTQDPCGGKRSPSPKTGTILEHFSVPAKNKTQTTEISLEEHLRLGAHLANSNLCVNNEWFKFGYLTALLEASGLCGSCTVDGLRSPDQLLDPSLYDEVETPLEEIPDDLKLFFDCANEALVETYRRSCDYLPWVSRFGTTNPRPFPSGEWLIQDVWKALNRIFVSRTPTNLERTVEQDLEGGDWTDARREAQYIGIEVEDSIFQNLLEETLLEWRHLPQLP